MFKDNEEKTTCRTVHSLAKMGMLTDVVKVESSKLKDLLQNYGKDAVTFLSEVYKAVTGSHFLDEDKSTYCAQFQLDALFLFFLSSAKCTFEYSRN